MITFNSKVFYKKTKNCLCGNPRGDSFYTNYSKELQAARQYNDVNKAFEIGLKVSVLEDGFKIWEDYRRENGIYCDMF